MPSRFSQQPANIKAQEFDYAALNSETQIVVQQRTSEIRSLLRRTAQDIFDVGQKLIEVKAQLGHGHFRTWLESEFDWSIWTATKFMQVADKFKCVKFSHLDIAPSALYELAAPSTPDCVRCEAIERASHGETITYSLAKAIKAEMSAQASQEPVRLQAESVTIDISAETIAEESFTVPEPSNPVEAQIVPEHEEQLSPLMESDKRASALPDLLNVEPDFLCTALLRNVESLSHEQINIL
ncbi:DUF3102 domain-containing protein [Synechocystis sp. PCC 7509]|uniref:DUF3102 domain-containing protein n=1 Tax=Synechocystis sp. PCC 7509 TaxID=927677 RepID=UPI0002AC9972|nr:DUF3102 domain-containing protein [Synechocystis sp. PCC 7509]